MKTVLIGAAGQLGRELQPLLSGDVIALTRSDVDLSDAARLRTCLVSLRPDRVVNCAAYNLVDRAETEPQIAFAVNAWAVRMLAEICRDLDATLVHFSTDYVFGLDSNRQSPWKETDAPGPVSAYGLSKLNGEYWARMICPKHIVIRTCGLYGLWGQGGKGGNFVETMLRVAGQGKPLRVVSDQICCPSFTLDVARASCEMIEIGRSGLFHLTNSGHCTWHEFAAEIFRLSRVTADLTPITSIEFGAAARRPAYSVLDNCAALAAGANPIRPWQEAIADYLNRRAKR